MAKDAITKRAFLAALMRSSGAVSGASRSAGCVLPRIAQKTAILFDIKIIQ